MEKKINKNVLFLLNVIMKTLSSESNGLTVSTSSRRPSFICSHGESAQDVLTSIRLLKDYSCL